MVRLFADNSKAVRSALVLAVVAAISIGSCGHTEAGFKPAPYRFVAKDRSYGFFGRQRNTNQELWECSGLAAHSQIDSLVWAHNDGGHAPVLYLTNAYTGLTTAHFLLRGASNVDWEDISVDALNHRVYVADLGDNRQVRSNLCVYRVSEPLSFSGADTIDAECFIVALPDGPRDIEAVFFQSSTQCLYALTKRQGQAALYEARLENATAGDTLFFEERARIPLMGIVAADLSRDEKSLVLKTYKRVLVWSFSSAFSPEQFLRVRPLSLPYRKEKQGEAVAWIYDSGVEPAGYVTLSEGQGRWLRVYKKGAPQGPF
jgi:hypothetical protein